MPRTGPPPGGSCCTALLDPQLASGKRQVKIPSIRRIEQWYGSPRESLDDLAVRVAKVIPVTGRDEGELW